MGKKARSLIRISAVAAIVALMGAPVNAASSNITSLTINSVIMSVNLGETMAGGVSINGIGSTLKNDMDGIILADGKARNRHLDKDGYPLSLYRDNNYLKPGSEKLERFLGVDDARRRRETEFLRAKREQQAVEREQQAIKREQQAIELRNLQIQEIERQYRDEELVKSNTKKLFRKMAAFVQETSGNYSNTEFIAKYHEEFFAILIDSPEVVMQMSERQEPILDMLLSIYGKR